MRLIILCTILTFTLAEVWWIVSCSSFPMTQAGATTRRGERRQGALVHRPHSRTRYASCSHVESVDGVLQILPYLFHHIKSFKVSSYKVFFGLQYRADQMNWYSVCFMCCSLNSDLVCSLSRLLS